MRSTTSDDGVICRDEQLGFMLMRKGEAFLLFDTDPRVPDDARVIATYADRAAAINAYELARIQVSRDRRLGYDASPT